MKILHINKYYHEADGVGRYMLSLMRAQEAAGHLTAPLAMHDPRNKRTPWEGFFITNTDTSRVGRGLGALRQLRSAWWNKEAYTRAKEILRAFAPDVVHVHNLYTHLSPSVLAACDEAGVPVVMTVHDYGLVSANYGLWDGSAPFSKLPASFLRVVRSRFIKNSLLATATLELVVRAQNLLGRWDKSIKHYIVLSESMKNILVTYGLSSDKIELVRPAAAPLQSDLVLEAVETLYDGLFVGRLEKYKGVDTALAAAKKFPDLNFAFAGAGPDEARLRYEAAGLQNVEFLGRLPGADVWRLMAASRAVLAPSTWLEPFGLVALEALAVGTPAIVSDRGGLPEIVEEGVSGFVVPAGDIDAFAERIQELKKSPAKSLAMRRAAHERALDLGNPEAALAGIMKVYQDVIHD